MTNKEVIEKLVQYFREHADFETMARALANLMIDNHRLTTWTSLPNDELECLKFRMAENSTNLEKFLLEGDNSDFLLLNIGRGD